MLRVLRRLHQCIGLLLCVLAIGLVAFPCTAHALEDIAVVTESDLAAGGKINGTNWMSGISGERYLHEITMPGTHDSGMANVKAGEAVLDTVSKKFWWTAETQDLGIDDQLAAGVRVFDLRLTDINPVWKERREGLWLCHGPRAAGRFISFTYYSEMQKTSEWQVARARSTSPSIRRWIITSTSSRPIPLRRWSYQ